MIEVFVIAIFAYAIGLMTGFALGLFVPKKAPKDEGGESDGHTH